MHACLQSPANALSMHRSIAAIWKGCLSHNLVMCVCRTQVNPNTIFVDSSPFKGAVVDTPDLYLKRWGFIGDPR